MRFVVAAVLLLLPLSAAAAPINYGNFVGTTVTYVQVTEDSITDPSPLFGAPTISGNLLDFNPVGFGSTSTGGAADVTDGQLLFEVWASPGNFVDTIQFSEAGDYTLFGSGTTATAASVALAGQVEIIEIDGVAVGGPGLDFSFNGVFSPSGGSYDLVNDPGVGVNWSGDVDVDIDQYLIDQGIDFVNGATKVRINLDNILVTSSEAGTTSIIQKKDFDGFSITVVPEPSTAATLGLGLLWLARRRRR